MLLGCASAPPTSRTRAESARAPSGASSTQPSADVLRQDSVAAADLANPAGREPTIDTSMFFATIAVSSDPSLLPSELRLHVRIADGPFGEVTRRGLGGDVQDGRIVVRVPEQYPVSRDAVTLEHRACSYVVDCDAEAIQTLGLTQLSENPTVSELVQFTNAHVSKKTLSRGFDIASEVAKSREGDCSEHAVLLAALCRRYHHAIRVIFGFAVIDFANRLPLLVGHAWTEVHDGQQWRLADAALANAGLERVEGFAGLRYLPVQVLGREDAGFRASLLTSPGLWQVERAEGPGAKPTVSHGSGNRRPR
jgi:hypothetical protein